MLLPLRAHECLCVRGWLRERGWRVFQFERVSGCCGSVCMGGGFLRATTVYDRAPGVPTVRLHAPVSPFRSRFD